MRTTKPIFDPQELDIITDDEARFHETYVRKLIDYAEGRCDGVQIRNLTAGAASLAKKQQSRSAMAVLKFNMLNKGDMSLIEDMTKREL